MGSCLSKKGSPSSSPINPKDIPIDANQAHRKVIPVPPQQLTEEEAAPPDEASGFVKEKEVFIIKHRKSQDRVPPESEKVLAGETDGSSMTDVADVWATSIGSSPIRGSKSTMREDEVDAILIQCGRLSNSNSRNSGGRKYSGSKRSYDFDHPNGDDSVPSSDITGDNERQLRRSQGNGSRRRTPSRERDQQRSGSRERGPGSRRVSRSPARRSENKNTKPGGKIVSVPATVTSTPAEAKRTAVPSPRPRSQSPATRQPPQQQQHPTLTLSRSSSRIAEHSPLRRNPLSEMDTNKLATTTNKEKPKNEIQETPRRKLTRSRSSRRTLDNLEFNPLELTTPAETTNPTSSYTALLLEDIQNFHQKITTLPPCVAKAHSIYQAVADLNEEKTTASQASSYQYSTNRSKDPVVESAVVAGDDLMEPSFHKYVTVKRGSTEVDRDEIESSGSNSFMGGGTPIQQPNWDLPSEPGSMDSSRSNATSDMGNDGSRIRKMNVKNRQQHLAASGAGVSHGRVQCR